MIRNLQLGMILLYDGKPVEVVTVAEGRMIGLKFLGAETCPECGRPSKLNLLEHAPLLQEHISPVLTIESR